MKGLPRTQRPAGISVTITDVPSAAVERSDRAKRG